MAGFFSWLLGTDKEDQGRNYACSPEAHYDYQRRLIEWGNDPFRKESRRPSAPQCMTARDLELTARFAPAIQAAEEPPVTMTKTQRNTWRRVEPQGGGEVVHAVAGAMSLLDGMIDPTRLGPQDNRTREEKALAQQDRAWSQARERLGRIPTPEEARAQLAWSRGGPAPTAPAPHVVERVVVQPAPRHEKTQRPAHKPEQQPILVENWPQRQQKSIFDQMMEE